MKGVKWFIACLILFGLFVPSLLISSDVNALKYAYDAFPLYQDLYTNKSSSNVNLGSIVDLGTRFQITFDSDRVMSYDSGLMDNTASIYKLCENPTLTNSLIISSTFISSYNEWSLQSGQNFRKNAYNQNDFCHPNSLSERYAYWWAFDSVYSAKYNLTTGETTDLVNVSNAFFDLNDDLYDEGSIKSMNIPLYLDSNRFDHISANTQLDWDFGLVQKSANNFPYLSDDFTAVLNLQYFDTTPSTSLSGTKHTDNISCSIDRNYRFTTYGQDLWEDFMGFNVHCTWTPTIDIYNLHPSISIRGSNSSTFLSYNYTGIYFTGTYLITNNDDTWSGEYANARPTGEDLESSPGYHQIYGYDDDTNSCNPDDWFCDLTHLFTFSFVNPFAPLFDMFTNNNNCVNIPTIAGMIHSEETTICPWFDSTTRNIVTPVLGLSSMMLVFGFAVHWLGARSGNLFEDSVDTDNYSFSNKFRRKK